MRQVVIVASDFIPSSYPPALRTGLLVRHLPEFGWQPTVVTVEPEYYEWPIDPENEWLLPDSLQVIRTRAFPARLTRKIGIGDIGLRSLWHHWRALRQLCRTNPIDLIFIPLPPHIPAILGWLIHRSFGIPYVIDYQDPWIAPCDSKPSSTRHLLKRNLSHILSRTLEPLALRSVSHLVGVSRGTTEAVIARYAWLTEADTTEIPSGGEAADFDYIRKNPRPQRIFNSLDGFFHMSYVGVCPPVMHDTVRAVFAAVKLGLERAPQLFGCIRLHFVGTSYFSSTNGQYQVLPLAEEAGLKDLVDECVHRIPYLDALQLLLNSHALLVIGSNAPHYTASKIFPNILARKPLLAIFHEASSVVKILEQTQAAEVVTFGSKNSALEKIEEISKHLEEILSLPPDYEPPTRWDAFENYTARAMAKRLAHVFDKVTA